MTRTSPPQVSFAAGEIDPLLHGRFDYQRFQTGLAKCHGFLPLPQGGAMRAPGSTWLGVPASTEACLLVPFQFAADDSVQLEFTPGLMRVWRYGVLVHKPDLSGPYTLATPFAAEDLATLRWVQSADVIYLADGTHPIQRLARLALNNWTLAPQTFEAGPFRVQNLDKDKTMDVSGFTGAITVTSYFPFFTTAHVGTRLMISPVDVDVPLLTSNTAINPGDLRRVDNNVYRMVSAAPIDSKEGRPIHKEGVQDYGFNTLWEFVCDDVGILIIDSVISDTEATATVLRSLHPSLVNAPSYRWSEQAWSAIYGYPSSLEIFDQRFVAAGTPSEPRTVWFSTVGAYADFTPSVEPDGAFAYTIAGTTSQNRITGLKTGRAGLHIFALSETYSTRSETRNQVIGPTTAVFGLDGTTGAQAGAIIAPNGSPIFITRDGKKLYLIEFDLQIDGNRELNLSRASQHLGAAGFAKVVWQATPEPRAWILTKQGTLAVLIFDQSEEILGWSTHSVAGRVIDIAVTQNADGTEDELWLVVDRADQTGGWTIERLDYSHYLFAAKVAEADVPFSTVTAPWLAGNTVSVFAAGDLLVDEDDTMPESGVFDLQTNTLRAVIGLADLSHEFQTLDIQAAAPDGSTIGRSKRLTGDVGIILHETRAGLIEAIETLEPRRTAPPAKAISILEPGIDEGLPAPFTGVSKLKLFTGQARRVQLRVRPVRNNPLTVLGLVPTIQEGGQ
jgi:hypothetical protein